MTTVMELMATKRATGDLEEMIVILRRQLRLVEAVTFRLHVLRLALAGQYPGQFDDADLGLTEAIEHLRLAELHRVIVRLRSSDDAQPDHADNDHVLRPVLDALACALDGTTEAAALVTDRLTFDIDVVVPITGRRVAMLRRLVFRCVPRTLTSYVDEMTARD